MKSSSKLISFILLFTFSCVYENQEVTCSTPVEISFKRDVLPIFNQHCNTLDCHSGIAPAGNLKLEPSTAYAQLSRRGKGYLDTINPTFSVLYASMNSRSDPMPPEGRLDACTLELVLEWIKQNAKNN